MSDADPRIARLADLLFRKVNHVNGDQRGIDKAELGQPCERAAAGFSHGALDLVTGLVQMDHDAGIQLIRLHPDAA